MDPQCNTARDDVQNIQLELKHVQAIQMNHSDRLLKIEKRQADDAALKSVWGTGAAFPNVLSGGMPQLDLASSLNDDIFDKFDGEQVQNILRSLQLEDEEEPARSGPSRANSVRFDVTGLQSSNGAVPPRYPGESVSTRPSSGFENHSMMEHTFSHKSDGRRSSAAYSIPDYYSVPSRRTSSLGLDTNFIISDIHDNASLHEANPKFHPGIFVLGSVPAIIRCWLTTNFSHDALLYAAICTGSQRSVIHYDLIKELGKQDLIHKDHTGRNIIKISMYLPEAIIIHSTPRSNSLMAQLPVLSVEFEVIGMNQKHRQRKSMQIFLGSDALRTHGADILFSKNLMTIYGDDKKKISIPFVRPEDDGMFKNLCVSNITPEKVGLKATAIPFTPTDLKSSIDPTSIFVGNPKDHNSHNSDLALVKNVQEHIISSNQPSPTSLSLSSGARRSSSLNSVNTAQVGLEPDPKKYQSGNCLSTNYEATDSLVPEINTFKSSNTVLASWRQENNDTWSQSGYQPATRRASRSMKILKPSSRLKSAPNNHSSLQYPEYTSSSSSSSSAFLRPSLSNESSPPIGSLLPKTSGEQPTRKTNLPNSGSGRQDNEFLKWDRSKESILDEPYKLKINNNGRSASSSTMERSLNPIGGASAFAWMNSGKTNGFLKINPTLTTTSGSVD